MTGILMLFVGLAGLAGAEDCAEQLPQEFLIRKNTAGNPEALRRSIAYRRAEYGSNVHTDAGSAAKRSVHTEFLGRPEAISGEGRVPRDTSAAGISDHR
ncbi:MAG: hypothetical protein IT285_06340 [Bdellovibrionales bacterium]|nr:hypothetical protein [Bdellovibrionales bacterium]